MQIRVIFALPSLVPPSLGALGSCPSRPPLDPPLAATAALLHIHSLDGGTGMHYDHI